MLTKNGSVPLLIIKVFLVEFDKLHSIDVKVSDGNIRMHTATILDAAKLYNDLDYDGFVS